MLNHLLRQGDLVIMQMDKESRGWGRKGVADGTIGTITGRTRAEGIVEARYPRSPFREPGVYSLDGAPIVLWESYPDGVDPTDPDYARVSATDIKPAPDFEEEWQLRYKTEWPVRLEDGSCNPDFCIIKDGYRLDNMERTGELPETPFWELDLVSHQRRTYRIRSIDYNRWGPDKLHCYDMEEVDQDGAYLRNGTLTVDPNHLELVSRGNVWREAHGQTLVFRSLREEAAFASGMGQREEVRNPKSGLYDWTLEEVLAAIEDGLVDGFHNATIPFNWNATISAVRFTDRDLGERLRAETLKGFKRKLA